jgi:rare lipoprotein A
VIALAATAARGFAALLAILSVPSLLAQTGAAKPKVERPVTEIPAHETGIASVYSGDLEGQLTASGQRYDGNRMTAAHRTLPLGTRVRVTDPATGTTVRVLVNDRWGGGPGRVINLSRRAAEEIGLGSYGQLTVQVEVERLGDGSVDPPEDEPVFREPLAPRIEATSNDPAARRQRCENEAEILGLRDQWRDNHVRTCLARKPLQRPR